MSARATIVRSMSRVRHYADILNDLFDPTPHMRVDRFFELACTLVRAGGMHGPGWDPWLESRAVIDDLQNLSNLELPPEKFPDVERTQARLALLSYCHITEMDLPYVLIANLLRLRLGAKYCMSPFADLAKPIGKKTGMLQKFKPPSPLQKIKRIKEMGDAAGMPKIGEALTEIYDSVVRNAVYHSDYILHDRKMHLNKDFRKSKTENGIYTPVVEFKELAELISEAFAFYGALSALYERCLRSFTDFKDRFLPYDHHYKGLLELVFGAEDKLTGFRVYWPNSHLSVFVRTDEGCDGRNLEFDPNGSINFFVGLYASRRGSFSPLVEHDAKPLYPERPGTTIRPHWPDPLKGYKLP
jgi:hypothetical protein